MTEDQFWVYRNIIAKKYRVDPSRVKVFLWYLVDGTHELDYIILEEKGGKK